MGLLNASSATAALNSPNMQRFTLGVFGILFMFFLPDAAIHVFICVASYALLYGSFGMQPNVAKFIQAQPKDDKLGCKVSSCKKALQTDDEIDGSKLQDNTSAATITARPLGACVEPPSSYADDIRALSKFVIESRQAQTDLHEDNYSISELSAKASKQVEIVNLMLKLQQRSGYGSLNLEHLQSDLLPRISAVQMKMDRLSQVDAAEDSLHKEPQVSQTADDMGYSDLVQKLSQFVNATREGHGAQHFDLQSASAKVQEQAAVLKMLKAMHDKQARERCGGIDGLGQFIAGLEPRMAAVQSKVHDLNERTLPAKETPAWFAPSPPPGLSPVHSDLAPLKYGLRSFSERGATLEQGSFWR